jgi:membrane-associated PAP2 superfamily phosphatase
LHDAGRWLSVGVLLLLAWDAWRPLVDGPPRAQRAYGVAVVLACAVAVPELRRMSATSCPWDLTEFGGTARYVSHWALVAIDSGPGRCFPSGHAVSGFALCGAVHAWRTHRPAWARAGLSIALALGLLFGITQVLRGAHYVSHVLWSGWLCLLITTVAAALEPRVLARQRA